MVWFVGLNPEPNTCRKCGIKCVTVVINAVCFQSHVSSCLHTGRVAREDCSGTVSAQLVATVSVVEQRPVATGQQSENGRYFKHCVVSWELSDNGCSFESSIARCIALVQVQDADGPRRRRRCEEQRRTLGRRRAGRLRRGGDTIGRVPVLGGCERLWQLRLRGVRQLQERALVQLQAESRALGTQQPQAWPR